MRTPENIIKSAQFKRQGEENELVYAVDAIKAMDLYAKEVAVHYLQYMLSKMFPSTFSKDTPIPEEAYVAFDKFIKEINK